MFLGTLNKYFWSIITNQVFLSQLVFLPAPFTVWLPLIWSEFSEWILFQQVFIVWLSTYLYVRIYKETVNVGRTGPRKKLRSRQNLFLCPPHTSFERFPLFPKEATISSLPRLLPITARNAGNAYGGFLTDVLYLKQNHAIAILKQWILFNHECGWPPNENMSLKITKQFRQMDKLTFEDGSVNMIIFYLKHSTMTIWNKKAKVKSRPYFKFSFLT